MISRCNKMYESGPASGIENDKNFVLATMLDPYFKNHLFDVIQQMRNKDWLITEVEGTISSDNLPEMDLEQHDEEDSDPFERLMSQNEVGIMAAQALSPPIIDERVRAISEVEDYLSRPRERTYTDSGSFWNDPINAAKYPHLRTLVFKYHSAPATSSESERLFSTAKLIATDLRSNLSYDKLEKLLFCHHNILILEFDY